MKTFFFKYRGIIFVIASLLIGFTFSTKVFGAEVSNYFDLSTNQPTWSQNPLTGINGGIFPIPSGFTCQYNFTTHCEYGTIFSTGDNLMKPFTSPNNTNALPDGTYTIVKETTQCSNGMDLATCKTQTGNDWQEITCSSSSCSGGGGTSTSTTTTGESVNPYGLIPFAVGIFFLGGYGIMKSI